MTADGRYVIYDTGAGSRMEPSCGYCRFSATANPSLIVQGGDFGAHEALVLAERPVRGLHSTRPGETEIYVQTFPQQTGKWQISATGGIDPMWRRDGKELFLSHARQKLMAVHVNTGTTNAGTFQAGIPKPLFQAATVPICELEKHLFSFA